MMAIITKHDGKVVEQKDIELITVNAGAWIEFILASGELVVFNLSLVKSIEIQK